MEDDPDHSIPAWVWPSEFGNDKEIGNGGHFVLSAWTAGNDAVVAERQSDQTILNQVVKNLRSMFGEAVPEPSDYVITRWGQDEFSMGSYSFNPPGSPGSVENARQQLGEPVESRLFWAGEATSEDMYGTTVGAFQTGADVAKDVLNFLQAKAVVSKDDSGKKKQRSAREPRTPRGQQKPQAEQAT